MPGAVASVAPARYGVVAQDQLASSLLDSTGYAYFVGFPHLVKMICELALRVARSVLWVVVAEYEYDALALDLLAIVTDPLDATARKVA